MLGSKLSNVPENVSFAVSFVCLRLRRGREEDYGAVGKSQVEMPLQDGSASALSEGGCALEGGV